MHSMGTRTGASIASIALIGAWFICGRTAAGQDDPADAAAPVTGAIHGLVLDHRDRPVTDALVIICDSESGLPIGAPSRETFISIEPGEHPQYDEWLYARTNNDGAFEFTDIPAGTYRLIAQSWTDVEYAEAPLEVNGLTVHLRGIADNITVPSDAAQSVEMKPLGNGTFVYHRGSGNSDWYIFLSRGKPTADPVLGPLGYRGPFLQQAIGYCRMSYGQVIFRGLPSTGIAYEVFASDSVPGWGAGWFRARDGQVVARDTNLVVGWSDGIHDPPPHLEELTGQTRTYMEANGGFPAIQALLVKGREEAWANMPQGIMYHHLFIAADILGPLDREIELPWGGEATVANLMAAAAYVGMQDAFGPTKGE